MRILKWIVGRTHGHAVAVESPLGWVPRHGDLDWRGLETYERAQFDEVMSVDRDLWQQEVVSHDSLFARLYDRLPKEMIFIRELILSALWRSPEHWGLPSERF